MQHTAFGERFDWEPSPSAALRPVIATLAPSCAKRMALARPIPEFPPVTSAILVSSILFIGVSPTGQLGHHSQGAICYYLSLLLGMPSRAVDCATSTPSMSSS